MLPLLNLLAVSMVWWGPGSCTGQVRSGMPVWGEAVFWALLPALRGGLQRLKWKYKSQRKAGLAVTFSLPTTKTRYLILGSVGPDASRWGTNQPIFASASEWQMLAHSHAPSTTAPSSPCSHVLLRDTPSHFTGSPIGNKSNLYDTRGRGGKEGTKSRMQSK